MMGHSAPPITNVLLLERGNGARGGGEERLNRSEREREKGGSILLNPCHASQFLRWLTMFPSLICPSFLLFIKLTDSMCQSFREELRAEDARNVLGLLLKAQSILENRFSIVFSKRYRVRNSSSTPNSSKTFPEHTEFSERTKRVGSLARGDLGFLVG